MAARADREPVARVHLRAHPAVRRATSASDCEGVEVGDRLGRGADRARRARAPRRRSDSKSVALERGRALVRAAHALLDLAQPGVVKRSALASVCLRS